MSNRIDREDVDRKYIECIKEAVDYIYDRNIKHIVLVRATIEATLYLLGIGKQSYLTRSKDMNIHYPREYSLLYRLASALAIYAYSASKQKEFSHIRNELISELCTAYDLCEELIAREAVQDEEGNRIQRA